MKKWKTKGKRLWAIIQKQTRDPKRKKQLLEGQPTHTQHAHTLNRKRNIFEEKPQIVTWTGAEQGEKRVRFKHIVNKLKTISPAESIRRGNDWKNDEGKQ